MDKSKILVVDDNKLSLRMIENHLTKSGFDVTTANNAGEALSHIQLKVIKPDLIISDVMMPGIDGYDFCRTLRRDPNTVQTPIILLTARGGIQEKIVGFKAGADDYLVKPIEPAELEIRIRVLLARTKAAISVQESTKPKGKVITVFSLRGGAGVTTLAVNLAVGLAQLWQTEVSLIDMSLMSAHVMMMLDLKSKHTLTELAEHQRRDALDRQVLDGSLVHHESGVCVLAGPKRPEMIDFIPTSLVPTLLPDLKNRFDYIVIDTASSFSEYNLNVFDLSDVIVLIVNPELASVKSSASTLDIFASLDYAQEKIAVVLNWTFPRGGLPQKNVKAALRIPIQAIIPYEETLFVSAINQGIPPVWKQPNAPASIVIQGLAYLLSQPRHKEHPPQDPSEMWRRVQKYLARSQAR